MDHKEGWAPKKNWCFQIVVLEKTLESPLDCKEIKPINPKGNQTWIFIGRTDAEAEAPVPWPPVWRASSLEKTLKLGKTEGRRRRGLQRVRWLDSITDSMDMNLSKLQEIVTDRGAWRLNNNKNCGGSWKAGLQACWMPRNEESVQAGVWECVSSSRAKVPAH